MKEWISIQVDHHEKVGAAIMAMEQEGWHFFPAILQRRINPNFNMLIARFSTITDYPS